LSTSKTVAISGPLVGGQHLHEVALLGRQAAGDVGHQRRDLPVGQPRIAEQLADAVAAHHRRQAGERFGPLRQRAAVAGELEGGLGVGPGDGERFGHGLPSP
jgi:hypothetical protein